MDDIKHSMGIVMEHGMACLLDEWFLETLQQTLQNHFIPQFWSHFSSNYTLVCTSQQTMDNPLVFAVCELFLSMEPFMRSTKILQDLKDQARAHPQVQMETRVHTLLKAMLFSKTPKSFQSIVHDFYSQAFKAFHSQRRGLNDMDVLSSQDNGSDEETDEGDIHHHQHVDNNDQCTCVACNKEMCCCQQVLQQFHQINSKL